MSKKFIYLVIGILLICGTSFATEVLPDFSSQNIPVLNEILREMQSSLQKQISNLETLNTDLQTQVDNLVTVPTGGIIIWTASALPTGGYLECNGSAVSRTTYSALFAVIGTTWGIGDGSTTFNVPDLRGRAPIGAGTGSGLSARSLAATGGEETHVLITSEMPAHVHTYTTNNTTQTNVSLGGAVTLLKDTKTDNTSSVGGDGAHNTMMPFLVTKYIIKT